MAIAQGSRTQVAYIAESTYGTTPATPTLKLLRITGHTPELQKGNFKSAELRPDRQITDFRLGERSVIGDIDQEAIGNNWDDFLEAALCGSWSIYPNGAPNANQVRTLSAGTTKRSFSMEIGHLDIAQYRLYTGVTIDKFNLKMTPNDMVKAKFSLMGRNLAMSGTTVATGTSGPYTPHPMTAFGGVVQEGGANIAYVTSLDFTLDNGIKNAAVIGTDLAYDYFQGYSDITGTIGVWFQDASLINKFIAETESAFNVTASGPNGPSSPTITNQINFNFPRIKYTSASTPVQNPQGITLTLKFQALLDSVTNTNLLVTGYCPNS